MQKNKIFSNFHYLAGADVLLALLIIISFGVNIVGSNTLWKGSSADFGLIIRTSEKMPEPSSELIKSLDKLVVKEHTVVTGENLWTIAARYGTNMTSLRSTNMLESTIVRSGQKIVVFNKRGLLHKVKAGESLEAISNKYKCPLEKLIVVGDFALGGELKPDTLVFVPNAQIRFEDFLYPVYGRLSSRFGMRRHPIFGERRFHEGIDLAKYYGAPVSASREGKIIYNGEKSGYGNCIMIRHGEGFVTLYAHLSAILVKSGQWVKKGQLIGRIGSSGWSTGPHLHFEVRKNGRPINPLRYLN
ncbi:MAG: M23 family metallopeptidase [Elusimicrobiota bacterium]